MNKAVHNIYEYGSAQPSRNPKTHEEGIAAALTGIQYARGGETSSPKLTMAIIPYQTS